MYLSNHFNWLLVFASYSSNKISNITISLDLLFFVTILKKYRFQLFKFFLYHIYSNFSCVIFYRDCFLVVLVLVLVLKVLVLALALVLSLLV